MNFFTAPSAATCSCDSSAAFSALAERVAELERGDAFSALVERVATLERYALCTNSWEYHLRMISITLALHCSLKLFRGIIKNIREIKEDLARLNRRG